MAKIVENYTPYRDEKDKELQRELDEYIKTLPPFCSTFFQYLKDEEETTVSTRDAYAKDFSIFFDFLVDYKEEYSSTPINELPVACLESLNILDLKNYFNTYLPHYERNGIERSNSKASRARKLASLKKLYHYCITNGVEGCTITSDPISAIVLKRPRKNREMIKYLEPDQTARLLDNIESNSEINTESTRTQKWRAKTCKRDFAIIALLLGTGVRVSECVGINMQDINFDTNEIRIRRKGNKEDVVYMNKEVYAAIRDYIDNERHSYIDEGNPTNALFISRNHQRITVRSVERLVKKYTSELTGTNDFYTHRLRSTFACNVLADTSDLKAVQEALGHESPETTARYYTKSKKEAKRATFAAAHLRES